MYVAIVLLLLSQCSSVIIIFFGLQLLALMRYGRVRAVRETRMPS